MAARGGPLAGQGDLVLIHGDEAFLVDRAAAEVQAAWRREITHPLSEEVFRAPAQLDEVRQSLATPAFLDPHRVVVLVDPPGLVGGRRPTDARTLADALTARDPSCRVAIVVRSVVPASNPVVALVRAAGEVRTLTGPRRSAIDAHLDGELRRRGLTLAASSRARLRRLAAVDLYRLDGELEKCQIAAGRDGTLDAATADTLITDPAASEIYELTDAIVEAPSRALAHLTALERRREGAPPPLLVASLARWLRDLIEGHARSARGLPAAAPRPGRPTWAAQRLQRQVRETDPGRLAAALETLADLDAAIRSGDVEAEIAIEAYVAELVVERSERPRPAG